MKEKLCYIGYNIEQEQKLALETTVLVEPYVVSTAPSHTNLQTIFFTQLHNLTQVVLMNKIFYVFKNIIIYNDSLLFVTATWWAGDKSGWWEVWGSGDSLPAASYQCGGARHSRDGLQHHTGSSHYSSMFHFTCHGMFNVKSIELFQRRCQLIMCIEVQLTELQSTPQYLWTSAETVLTVCKYIIMNFWFYFL